MYAEIRKKKKHAKGRLEYHTSYIEAWRGYQKIPKSEFQGQQS